MKKLIIAEKPSLARTIVEALKKEKEVFKKEDGFFESDNYIVTSAFGHLYSLADIEDYTGSNDKKWYLKELPFFPDQFKFQIRKDYKTKQVDSGVKKRVELIKSLIHQDTVQSIINCGDSDREGEVIIRTILSETGNTKPVERLWLPDQTAKTILENLKNIHSASKYDSLAKEGYARSYMDWLYGINLTRYCTLISQKLLKVGRVKTAIIKAVYDRSIEIKNFVPRKYFKVISKTKFDDEHLELISEKEFEFSKKEQAIELAHRYNRGVSKVVDKSIKSQIVRSPKLFSQSTLQNQLSKRFKYSPKKTLSLVQELYELGLVSYPRTPTEYLAVAEKQKVKDILSGLENDSLIFKDEKYIFDDSKIESHSAIIPTGQKAKTFKNEDLKNCYETIMNRFSAVFCKEDHVVEQTILKIEVNQEEVIETTGKSVVSEGWTKFEGKNTNDKLLPMLLKGDQVVVDFKAVEKTTNPPKKYTVETLNNYLKNPFRKEIKELENEDDEEYKALLSGSEIGTEATRPGILDDSIQSGYLHFEKATYDITILGEKYIEVLEELKVDISTEKTIEMNKLLKNVYHEELTVNEVVEIVKAELNKTITQKPPALKTEFDEKLGVCPKCQKQVFERRYYYECESNVYEKNSGKWTLETGCGFKISKKIAKKNISVPMVKQLIEQGKTKKIRNFTSSKGTKFDAALQLNEEFEVKFLFK